MPSTTVDCRRWVGPVRRIGQEEEEKAKINFS